MKKVLRQFVKVGTICGNCPVAQICYFSHIFLNVNGWSEIIVSDQVPFKRYFSCRQGRIYSSGFLFGFFGLRERLLALHSGQIGALRWICWWQDKQAWRGGEGGNHVIFCFCCAIKISKQISLVVSGCVWLSIIFYIFKRLNGGLWDCLLTIFSKYGLMRSQLI